MCDRCSSEFHEGAICHELMLLKPPRKLPRKYTELFTMYTERQSWFLVHATAQMGVVAGFLL